MRRSLAEGSLDDAVPEVGDDGGLDHPGAFELGQLGAEMVEQSDAAAQEQRDQVDLQLVEQPSFEVLLSDIRAASHRAVLSPAAA